MFFHEGGHALSTENFAAAFAEGQAMTTAQAIQFALS